MLISAAIDAAVMGDDPPEIPQESQWWAEMVAAEGAAAALRRFIRGAAPLFARASPLSEVLRAAALTDDELHRVYQHHEDLRTAAFAEVIDVLRQKGQLRPGLDPDAAADILLVLLGDTTYCLFTAERGWTHDQTIDWLCDTIPAALLDPTSDRFAEGAE